MTDYDIRVGMDGYPFVEHTEDGAIDGWQNVFFIECTDADGHRWTLDSAHNEKDEAAAEAAAAAARNNNVNPTTAPDRWAEGEPVYGSEAWDAEAEYRLACMDADAYDEPRPRWCY